MVDAMKAYASPSALRLLIAPVASMTAETVVAIIDVLDPAPASEVGFVLMGSVSMNNVTKIATVKRAVSVAVSSVFYQRLVRAMMNVHRGSVV